MKKHVLPDMLNRGTDDQTYSHFFWSPSSALKHNEEIFREREREGERK